jgi:hypothetical protein
VSPDDQPDLDPGLADAVRGAYVRPVDEVTASRHLSAMVAAASAGAEPVARRSRHRRGVWRSVLAAAAATLALPVGLAVAGVSLPNAIEQPYRSVGITLPHQTRHAPAPAKRPVTPRAPSTTPATAAPARPAEQRARHPDAGRGHRHRAKRQANPVDRARRHDNPRGPSVRPPARPTGGANKHGRGPRRSTGPQHKPAAPTKPTAGPKQGPKSPRTSRKDKGQPG